MPPMQRPFILLAAVLALLAAAPSAHAAKRTVPRGFFSVMWDRAATEAPAADQEAQWALMAQSGVESVRTVFTWARIEPEPGVFDYSRTDQVVAQASRRRIALLPVLRTAPPWAMINPFAPESPPRNVSDFAVFVQALIGRYGPQGSFWTEHPELPKRPLRTWQIWNEPHLQEWWNTEGRSPNAWAPEYAALLKTAKKAIDAADPGAHRRAGGARRLRLEAPGAAQPVRDRPLLRRRGDQPVHRASHVRHARRPLRPAPDAPRGRAPQAGLADRVDLARRQGPRVAPGRLLAAQPGTRPTRAWPSACAPSTRSPSRTAASSGSGASSGTRGRRPTTRDDLFDYSGLLRYTGGVFEQRPALAAYAKTARRYEGCRKTAEGRCR